MNRNEALAVVAGVNNTYNAIAPHFSLTRYKLWGDFEYFKPYIHSGQEILDAGCGNGRLIEFFAQLSVQYTGFDPSGELIKQARVKAESLPKNESTHIQLYVDSLLNKPKDEKQYDVVFCVAVLHHIPQALHQEVLQNLFAYVKPGGYVMITVWNMYQSSMLATWFKCQLQRALHPTKLLLGIPAYKYSWKDLFVAYRGAGNNEQRYVHGFSKSYLRGALAQHGTIEFLEYTKDRNITSALQGKNIIAVIKK